MNAIAELQPPRLPFHPAVADRFGIDKSGWKALVEAVYPLAKTPDSVVMALSYCKARKLDPFKKPVHIVPMWDSRKKGYVETIWPGISEVRTTAFRTGQYAGCDEAEFGPTLEKTFSGKVKKGDGWQDQTVEVAFPEWCRMTVYRVLGDRVCKFVGPKVKWLESYATIGNTDLPNDMWQSRPEGQIEKCAEAAALRKAFPEELGNQLTAEEMEGRRVEGDVAVADVSDVAQQRRLPPAPPASRQIAHVEKPEHEAREDQRDEPAREEAKAADRATSKPAGSNAESTQVASGKSKAEEAREVAYYKELPADATAEEIVEGFAGVKAEAAAYDPAPILAEINVIFASCTDDDDLEAKRAKLVMPLYDRLTKEDQETAKDAYRATRDRIASEAETADIAANEAAAADAGDPVGPDERGHPEDDAATDDRPADQPPVERKPEKMDAAELEAHIAGYIETMTDADALKKRWYMDDELREILDDKTRQALRTKWKARMDELRAAEGQG